MSYISLDIDARDLERIALDLSATDQQAEQALRSTLGKVANWLRARSVRGLSKELQLPARVLRRRLKTFRITRHGPSSEITVWYGLDPVALIHLNARQTRAGVTAGAHKRQGAFIAAGKNDNRQVFKRSGKARLPIEKQKLDVQDKADIYIEDELIGAAEFTQYFLTVFEREMKWRMQTQK